MVDLERILEDVEGGDGGQKSRRSLQWVRRNRVVSFNTTPSRTAHTEMLFRGTDEDLFDPDYNDIRYEILIPDNSCNRYRRAVMVGHECLHIRWDDLRTMAAITRRIDAKHLPRARAEYFKQAARDILDARVNNELLSDPHTPPVGRFWLKWYLLHTQQASGRVRHSYSKHMDEFREVRRKGVRDNMLVLGKIIGLD